MRVEHALGCLYAVHSITHCTVCSRSYPIPCSSLPLPWHGTAWHRSFDTPCLRVMETGGLVEIVGKHSTGRTSMAFHMAGCLRTLYIASSICAHRVLPQHLWARTFSTLLELKAFLSHDLFGLVDRLNIECVIVDALDEFFYVYEKPRLLTEDLSYLVRMLKMLSFRLGLRTVVVNSYYGSWAVDGLVIFNPYLGLRWQYAANVRYLVTRDGESRYLSRFGDEYRRRFRITDKGVVLDSEDGE